MNLWLAIIGSPNSQSSSLLKITSPEHSESTHHQVVQTKPPIGTHFMSKEVLQSTSFFLMTISSRGVVMKHWDAIHKRSTTKTSKEFHTRKVWCISCPRRLTK